MAAVSVATQGAVGPMEFWTMRLDLLIGACLGRAMLMKRQSPPSHAADKGYEDRPDGTRAYKIGSLADLYNCPALTRS